MASRRFHFQGMRGNAPFTAGIIIAIYVFRASAGAGS